MLPTIEYWLQFITDRGCRDPHPISGLSPRAGVRPWAEFGRGGPLAALAPDAGLNDWLRGGWDRTLASAANHPFAKDTSRYFDSR
jgi:hypothetical protein